MSSKYARLREDNIITSTVDYVPIDNLTVPEFLHQRFQQIDPNCPCLIDVVTSEQFTYGQFMSKVHSFALALIDLGVKQTDTIFFSSENSLTYSIAYLGALFAGVPVWQMSPTDQAFEASHRISNAPEKSVVYMYSTERRHYVKQMYEEYSHFVKDIIRLQIEMDSFNEPADESIHGEPMTELRVSRLIQKFEGQKLERFPYYPVEDIKTATAMITCTSGTTGQPKGAMHSHYSMVNYCNNIGKQLRSLQGDKTLLFFALGHASGSFYLPLELSMGNTVYMAANVTTEKFAELTQRYKITHSLATPYNVFQIATGDYEKKYDLSSLKIVYTGGTVLPSFVADNWVKKLPNCPLFNLYGMTEFLRPSLPRYPEHSNILEHAATVTPGTDLKIQCLETGSKLGLNRIGEICIRGPVCFKGYYRNPEATKSAFDSEGFFHTGDVGFVDDNLCVHIHDRIKEMIKVFCETVFPNEIEKYIQMKYPQVDAVCIVGVPQPSGDTHLRAFIALKEGTKLTEEEIIQTVASNFQPYKHLKAGVVFVDEMPRTVIGKVDRQYFKRLIQTC